MNLSDLEKLLKKNKAITFVTDTDKITFDMKNVHERHYALKMMLNVKYPLSDMDDMLFDLLIRSGDAVLDGGANIGFTALGMLHSGAGKVIAVEPVPEIFTRLTNLDNPKIYSVNAALSSKIDYVELTLSTLHNQGSSIKPEMLKLSSRVFGETHQTIQVPTTTIDTLVNMYGHFDVWKLDLEGAEIDALDGAVTTLKNDPPRSIIVELYPPFLNGFKDKILPILPYAYRVAINVSTYKLTLLPVDVKPSELYHVTSPMFVFSESQLL